MYGAALPAFTAVYSGFVNGDTSAVLRGAPSLTTTATPASPAGTYPITAASGTLSAANYTFSFVNGSLTVDQITLVPGISFTLTSSLNPSTYGQSVTFTATIPPAATGTMQFLDNGVAMGSPVAVVSGVATYTTSAITVGTQAITAYYSGDSNYSPATSLPVNQVVNSTATVTQISSSLNPSTYGSPVTFSIWSTPMERTRHRPARSPSLTAPPISGVPRRNNRQHHQSASILAKYNTGYLGPVLRLIRKPVSCDGPGWVPHGHADRLVKFIYLWQRKQLGDYRLDRRRIAGRNRLHRQRVASRRGWGRGRIVWS